METPQRLILPFRSDYDGSDCVAIAIPEGNRKTGDMVQVGMQPIGSRDNVRAGNPGTCGPCPLASICCYPWVRGAWRQHGAIESPTSAAWDWSILERWAQGLCVRWGSYGDVGSMPYRLRRKIARWELNRPRNRRGTMYSESWRKSPRSPLRLVSMASCVSPEERAKANRAGWRTFRIRPIGAPILHGEIDCPSSRGVHCADCRLCSGARTKAKDVTIEVHGTLAVHSPTVLSA